MSTKASLLHSAGLAEVFKKQEQDADRCWGTFVIQTLEEPLLVGERPLKANNALFNDDDDVLDDDEEEEEDEDEEPAHRSVRVVTPKKKDKEKNNKYLQKKYR